MGPRKNFFCYLKILSLPIDLAECLPGWHLQKLQKGSVQHPGKAQSGWWRNGDGGTSLHWQKHKDKEVFSLKPVCCHSAMMPKYTQNIQDTALYNALLWECPLAGWVCQDRVLQKQHPTHHSHSYFKALVLLSGLLAARILLWIPVKIN